jgi:hypothetical protein
MHADRTHNLTGGGPRRLALLAIAALLAALALPSAASAARGLTTGFSASDQFQGQNTADRGLWLNRTADVGAGIVRLGVEWPGIAPNRPPDPTNPGSTSYDWSSVDGAVRDAEARGLKVLLSVNHAPAWAEGPGRPSSAAPGTWRPNPADLADFMRAVASRYNGSFDPGAGGTLPAVQAIEVWDEPNSSDWLNPQFEGKNFTGADLYREMLNVSYKAIKDVFPAVQVVVGATAPYGDPPGGPYPGGGTGRSRPVQFWERVFCLREQKVKKKKKKGKKAAPKLVRDPACTGKASFDVFAHHPIDNTGGGPLKSGPTRFDASTPDLGRVVTVLRAAEKAGTAQGGRHPTWVTEFWWDSKPPNPVGAPLATQARWIEQSLYLFWKGGASTAINFQLVDSNLRPTVHAGFQSGIYFSDGRPKPSLTAFKFPFVTNRTTRTKLEAWGKAPESGKLLIQRQQGSRWRTVKKLQVSKGGVFDTSLRLSGKQRLRATVGSSKSLVWKQAAATTRAKKSGSGPAPAPIALISIGALALLLAALRLRARRRIRLRRERGARPLPAKPA